MAYYIVVRTLTWSDTGDEAHCGVGVHWLNLLMTAAYNYVRWWQ